MKNVQNYSRNIDIKIKNSSLMSTQTKCKWLKVLPIIRMIMTDDQNASEIQFTDMG